MRSKSSDDDARKHVHPMEVENESGEVDPEPKEAQAARLGRTVRHDHVIRAASVAIVAVVLGIALVSADTFINAVGCARSSPSTAAGGSCCARFCASPYAYS